MTKIVLTIFFYVHALVFDFFCNDLGPNGPRKKRNRIFFIDKHICAKITHYYKVAVFIFKTNIDRPSLSAGQPAYEQFNHIISVII